ncbi:MAG: CusA/CzcA family heavy metal efflux RND transporter [Bacteroidetes bacterium]|nr:CusA/CzcA family heavy metal efflux RND transporter [Bacteroidota bacterium]
MLNSIIGFSIRNKLIIGLAVIGLILFGSYQFTKLPIDAVPDITNNQVQVITVSPSLGAPDVERLITFPIEQACSTIPGLLEIRSFSRFGLSLVTIVFSDETDVYWARQQVSEKLVFVKDQIPSGVGIPELGPVTTGLGEIYQYVVRPAKGYENKIDVTQLRTIQDWIVRRQLLGIKGVADVSSFGGKLKQYEIAVDAAKLQAFGLSMEDIFHTLESNNQNTGGAYIEKGPSILYIRSEGLVNTTADIASMLIKQTSSGSPIFIRDVADVRFGFATRYGAMTFNGEQEVAGAVVMMLKGANSNEVIKLVKERIDHIRATLPEGVEIEAFLDRTKMVNNAIGTVETNLMEGALIVVFVLVLFLGNMRAGLLVASVIPLAMLFAVILMNLFGVSGNLMSLGALDFGLIVDGAVIIVEAVMHGLHGRKVIGEHTQLSRGEMDTTVEHAAGKMMNSAVFGQIIILIVYLPIFSLQGIEGKMFKPMAQTVAFALLGAFLLSLTYVPMMSAWVLSRKLGHEPDFSDKFMQRISNLYQHMLEKVLHKPKQIILAAFILFIGSLGILLTMGGEFIPSLEEGDFAVETRVITGSNLNVSIDAVSKASKVLKEKFPEVEKVVAKIGSGEIPTDPMPVEAADLMIILKPKKEWVSAKTFPELQEKMSEELSQFPGVFFGFQYPVQMRFNELMTGARQDVVCKIFGENLDSLALYAKQLGALVSTVDGATDLYIETVTGMPQIVISYNRQQLAQFGLSVSDVNRVVNTAFAGQVAGLVYEGERRFDLVVRLASEKRSNLNDVQNLLIPTSRGTQIPLSQVAQVSIQEGPAQIQREDAKRRIVVGFNVRGRDVQSIVEELQAKATSQLKFAPGYYTTYGGSFKNLEEAKQRLSIAVPLSLLLILMMLYFAFKSVKQGLLIFTAIPLSAVGGIFALAARGMPFSISAGVGFIALFGVAVLNGIVLLAEFNRLKGTGLRDLNSIVKQGTSLRLRPVLMTAFVASLGFLPMAISNGSGAEVQRPLATVVIGGLLLATFLTLFVLPSLYVLANTPSKHKAGKGLAALLLMLFSSGGLMAQNYEPISLHAAIDSALANNLNLRSAKLETEYQQLLANSAWSLPQTQIQSEWGSYNSALKDNKVGINQAFEFPGVYSSRKKSLREDAKAQKWQSTWKAQELKTEVAKVYFQLLALDKKSLGFAKADSVYSDFLNQAKLRFEKGETHKGEYALAKIQQVQLSAQVLQLKQEKQAALLYFQFLLNTSQPYSANDSGLSVLPTPEQNAVSAHPLVLAEQAYLSSAKYSLRTNKQRLLPGMNMGMISQTIRGFGADEKLYGPSDRFLSFQAGIGLPLFFGSQQASIRAASTQVKIREIQLKQKERELLQRIQVLQSRYSRASETYSLYKNQAESALSALLEQANEQFRKGEINYLEYSWLFQQAIQNQMLLLDAELQLRESWADLQFFNP